METIKQAKKYLRENWLEGVSCPCCSQFVKLWRHKVNSQIAKCLIQVYRISEREGREWVHILNEIKPSNRMYSLARHWELLKAKEFKKDEDKKSNGFWKITPKGKEFVKRQYNNSKICF